MGKSRSPLRTVGVFVSDFTRSKCSAGTVGSRLRPERRCDVRRLIRLRRALNDLSKALVYRSDAPFHVPSLLLPSRADWHVDDNVRSARWVRRFCLAYFAWHGQLVRLSRHDIAHDTFGPLIGVEGMLYPLRPAGCPFDEYETAVVFIRDGTSIPEAFEMSRLLGLGGSREKDWEASA